MAPHSGYAWSKLAEYAAGFKKDPHIRVEGELRRREYETFMSGFFRAHLVRTVRSERVPLPSRGGRC
jgi:hypothetical protein